jgi:hypothetical protein
VAVYQQHHCGSRLLPRFFQVKAASRFGVETPATGNELGIIIRVIHVSGKRMIKVGVDGVSRGDLNAGVMAGANMLSFVPLHLSAVDCLEGLLPWLLVGRVTTRCC